MSYACVLEITEEKYTLLEFANTAFKAREPNIDSKVLQVFRIVYAIFYENFQQYRKVK